MRNLAWLLAFSCVSACSGEDRDTNFGTTGTSSTGGQQSCTPGVEVDCSCPSGAPGTQRCADDGSGYEDCAGCGSSSTQAAECLSAQDCPVPSTPCTSAQCMFGNCTTSKAPEGSSCPNGKCDVNGSCAECLADDDCQSGCCSHKCVNLDTDPGNCGACGHSCQEGGCEAGACQPIVLAADQPNPVDVAVDLNNVYWVNWADGTVMTVPKAGGLPKILALSPMWPDSIAVDEDFIYWADPNATPGVLKRIPVEGGPATTMAQGDSPDDVHLTTADVFWIDFKSIKRIPKGGGVVQTLVTTDYSPSQLAVDSEAIYWTSHPEGTVMRQLVADGAAPIVLASSQNSPWAIAVDATSVYWTSGNGDCEIQKVPKEGGSPVTLVTDSESCEEIALDETNIYWQVGQTIAKTPVNGGAKTIVATNQKDVTTLVLDDTSVYWTSFGYGMVLKVAK